jgi:hypothetical protein
VDANHILFLTSKSSVRTVVNFDWDAVAVDERYKAKRRFASANSRAEIGAASRRRLPNDQTYNSTQVCGFDAGAGIAVS